MLPNIDPRQMKHMMRQMGMNSEELEAVRVIIETNNKKIIVENPSVTKIVMQGKESFQISGQVLEEELKPQIDKVITLGKKNTNASRMNAFSSLRDSEAVTKVFSDLSKRFEKRQGGYCRIVKAGFRTGDKAPMAYIQLLDQEAK